MTRALHIIRLFFLVISLCVAGFAWTYHSHPEWVGRVDRWFCDRHMDETRSLWQRVQVASEGSDSGLHGEVEQHLLRLGTVSYGERRFELWRSLVIWFVGEATRWDETERAIAWQEKIAAARPRDVEQGLVLVGLLGTKGRPKDLTRARELLNSIRRGLPDWAPALEADMDLSLVQGDWDALVEALRQWQGLDTMGMERGWKCYYRIAGEAKLQSSSSLNAVSPDQGATHVVTMDWPGSVSLTQLRVDPPARAVGILERFNVAVRMNDGQWTDARVLTAKDSSWLPQPGQLQLSGQSDPRLTLELPKTSLQGVRITFVPKRALPARVRAAAVKHAELAKRLQRAGLLTTNGGGKQ